MGCKSVLITNGKSHMSFRLVPKAVILNDLDWRNQSVNQSINQFNGHYFALFYQIQRLWGQLLKSG